MDMRREDLIGDWIMHHSFGILSLALCRIGKGGGLTYFEEIKLDQLACIQWLARYRIYHQSEFSAILIPAIRGRLTSLELPDIRDDVQ